ncbi:MAG: hypothetical protein EOR81_17185 [Mesorhizobium sp.]|nr:MAG: hypothetical protein EOR81_17185 [Mesorhizobium sp.]
MEPTTPQPGSRASATGRLAKDEAEHFEFCPVCGQRFDKRDLGEVLHHYLPEHEPLKLDG